jgi:hypothetical protein
MTKKIAKKKTEKKAAPAAKIRKNGRPLKFTTELSDEICSRISQGESLNKICKDEHIPCQATIFSWMRTQEDFLKNYTRAREEQAETLADEIVQIADDAKRDTYFDNELGREVTDHEVIARSRLRVEARKWVAAKLKPKKYGDFNRVQAEIKDTSENTSWLGDVLNSIDKNK